MEKIRINASKVEVDPLWDHFEECSEVEMTLAQKLNEAIELINGLALKVELLENHWHEYEHSEPTVETTTGPIVDLRRASIGLGKEEK